MKLYIVFITILIALTATGVESKPTADGGVIGKPVQLSACCPDDRFCCSGKMFLKKLMKKKVAHKRL